jgi:DNA-3-methyladenine glycosylase I
VSAPGNVAVVGEDGVGRCPWGGGGELLAEYHDREWGRVLHGRDALYERISL